MYNAFAQPFVAAGQTTWKCEAFGWHYLSHATCLIRPHLLSACFVVSRITILCFIIRHI